MLNRLIASTLGLMLLLTSGATGSVLFLCSMDGQLKYECCCGPSKEKPKTKFATLELPECCQSQTAAALHSPATLETARFDKTQRPFFPATPRALASLASPKSDADRVLFVRGPPVPPLGPALFCKNCSYLI